MSPTNEIQYPIETAHATEVQKVVKMLHVRPDEGLSKEEVSRRSQKYGLNSLQEQPQKNVFLLFLEQFKSPIVLLLALASGVSFFFQHWLEGYSILGVIFITAAIGFFMELQARRSVNALKKLDVIHSKVLRGKHIEEIPSEEITVGDIILLEAGDIVPGDGRIFEVNQLEIDESALTGESLPVAKNIEAVAQDTTLGDRYDMVFKGTSVVKGNARCLITAIGAHTELGKISALVAGADAEATPLEKKLQSMTKKLIWVTGFFTVIFVATGMVQGKETFVIFETAIALAVAAIPEGLPIVATIALTYGMLRMARKNVLIKKLSSVETLGGTNVIFTDKTGTLTENKIEADTLVVSFESFSIKDGTSDLKSTAAIGEEHKISLEKVLEISALCNNADVQKTGDAEKQIGDPLEIALLQFVSAQNVDSEALRSSMPRVAEIAFSSETKIMGTLHKKEGAYMVAAKGAVEEIIEKSKYYLQGGQQVALNDEAKNRFLEHAEALQHQGLRALGFAYADTSESSNKEFIKDLVFVGIIGFLDPPRVEVIEALKSCRMAGIKVIMITGDHPATALNIAEKIQMADTNQVVTGKELESSGQEEKLLAANIFARVTPKQKLDMITLYQKRGDVVAMTGDGINDAPAIKKADIGIAMGLRGTAVAKETADVVLKEDSFAAIVLAVEQGRTIFQNIKRFMVYLLSCNLSEILIVFVLGLFQGSFTLLPLQILFLNILTDIFPALALGMGEGDAQSMRKPPRNPEEPVLVGADWWSIGVYSGAITVSILITTWYASQQLHYSPEVCNNIAFLGIAFAQLWHVFNLPSYRISFFRNEVTYNRYIWYAILLCSVLLLLFYSFEPLRKIVNLQLIESKAWILIGLASIAPVLMIQIIKRVFKVFE